MENPLKTARLNAGLTIDALARRAEVSKQLVIRAEQGTYVNPPPNLLSYLFPLSQDQPEIIVAYHDFQITTRTKNAHILLPTLPLPPVGEHPFIVWRTASEVVTTMRFCILFCVQHAILHKYETKPLSVQQTPTNLREALLDAGIAEETVLLLDLYFKNYKNQLRTLDAA